MRGFSPRRPARSSLRPRRRFFIPNACVLPVVRAPLPSSADSRSPSRSVSSASSPSATNTACIPDPEGDYDDFKARTANLGPPEQAPTGDASFDSKPPETAVEALYVGICVTSLAAGDPEQALRFYTETKYTPDAADAASGKLAMTVTPMVGWDVAGNRYVSPATVRSPRGAATRSRSSDVAVTGDGRFTASLGTVHLAQEANSVSGRAAVIEGTTLDGRFSAGDRFCSTLGGLLTVPYQFTFDPKQNTCLFTKVKEGDPLPKIDSSEFVCSL